LWVGIIGAILGVIGLILSVYFYRAAQISPALTYAVHPVKTELQRPDYDKDLGFTYGGRPVESESITAVQVSIWNAGTRSIRESDILEKVALVMPDGASVLRARVKKTSRAICAFECIDDREAFKAGRCEVRWRILEPGDAAVIQVIYSGSARTDPRIEGVIEGQSVGIETLALALGRGTKRPLRVLSTTGTIVLGVVVGIPLVLFVIINVLERRSPTARKLAKAKARAKKRANELQKEHWRNRPVIVRVLTYTCLLLLCLAIVVLLIDHGSGPPFGW
jgi:hypothetical protein